MHLVVENTPLLSGQVTVPPSKSHSIRAIFLASLCRGKSLLYNVLDSTDVQDAIRVCSQLGARITRNKNSLPPLTGSSRFPSPACGRGCRAAAGEGHRGEVPKAEGGYNLIIDGINKEPNKSIVCQDKFFTTGNSGIATRFILPLLGFRGNSEQPVRVDCGEQMRARPLGPFINALRQLGLSIECLDKQDFCPLRVSGNLQGGVAELEGISSQNLSALLIALPCAQKDSVITVKNLQSRPYVDMTLDWLKQQNITYTHQQEHCWDIFKLQGRQTYKKFETFITGDFSSASYLIAAGVLIPGSIELYGLNTQDAQGDKQLLPILEKMGADVRIEPERVTLYGGKKLEGIPIDARDIPDLVPTLAVIGTYAAGKTDILHVKHARIKETDRIYSMVEGLRRLGAHIEEHEEGMTVYQSKLIGAPVRGFGDHRTIMALGVAGLLATGTTLIDGSEGVHKTFPDFVKGMQAIGANIKQEV